MLLNQIILKIIYKQSQETSEEFKSQKLRGFEVEIDKNQKDDTAISNNCGFCSR